LKPTPDIDLDEIAGMGTFSCIQVASIFADEFRPQTEFIKLKKLANQLNVG